MMNNRIVGLWVEGYQSFCFCIVFCVYSFCLLIQNVNVECWVDFDSRGIFYPLQFSGEKNANIFYSPFLSFSSSSLVFIVFFSAINSKKIPLHWNANDSSILWNASENIGVCFDSASVYLYFEAEFQFQIEKFKCIQNTAQLDANSLDAQCTWNKTKRNKRKNSVKNS